MPARGGVVRPVQARVGVAGVMRGVGQALVSGVRLGAMSGLRACAARPCVMRARAKVCLL